MIEYKRMMRTIRRRIALVVAGIAVVVGISLMPPIPAERVMSAITPGFIEQHFQNRGIAPQLQRENRNLHLRLARQFERLDSLRVTAEQNNVQLRHTDDRAALFYALLYDQRLEAARWASGRAQEEIEKYRTVEAIKYLETERVELSRLLDDTVAIPHLILARQTVEALQNGGAALNDGVTSADLSTVNQLVDQQIESARMADAADTLTTYLQHGYEDPPGP